VIAAGGIAVECAAQDGTKPIVAYRFGVASLNN
jgi:hypothetical protein